MKKFFILPLTIICISSFGYSSERFITVMCEGGRWEGNSIDSTAGGETEFTANGTGLAKTTYKIPYPPKPFSSEGGLVKMSYGDDEKYDGIITYFHDSALFPAVQNDYVVINVKPQQILERHMILIPSGEVHLTYSKIYGGALFGGPDTITTQSFAKKCTVSGF